MPYTKVTCILDPDSEIARELLIAELGNAGFESFTETDEAVEAFIPSGDFSEGLLESDQFQQNDFFRFTYSVEEIADQNWNEVWEQNYFEPLLIEDQCLVRAPFHTVDRTARYEIIISPRMAFGTGNHETTHLMVKAMLGMDIKGKNVLDMGCGSGILAILAAMKGAGQVTAIDIDKWSFENTVENAALNNTGSITVLLGDAGLLKNLSFHLILANIQRNILLQDMEAYRDALLPGGELVMSGFFTSDLEKITEKAVSLGFQPGQTLERSDWCAARFILR